MVYLPEPKMLYDILTMQFALPFIYPEMQGTPEGGFNAPSFSEVAYRDTSTRQPESRRARSTYPVI